MKDAHVDIYSVFRFIPSLENEDGILEIREALEKVTPDLVGRHNKGFSVSISSSLDFDDHLKSLYEFLERFAEQIELAKANNVFLEFDIGLSNSSNSRIPASYLRILPKDLQIFSSHGILLEISIYWGAGVDA